MTHLFLAYSRDDRRIMEPLRDALRGYGLTVWTDEHLAPGTPDWEITIERQIKEAGAVIVLLSPQASAPGSYVRNEIRLALLHGRPIFPVLAAGDATTAIPASLITHQYIDLRGRTQRNADEAVYQLAHAAADALGVAVQQPAATVLTVNIGGDVYGDVNMAGRDLTHQQAPTAQVETQGWPLLDRLARV